MRYKVLFAVILIQVGAVAAFCDVGNCVRYKVDVGFENGGLLTGFNQVVSYEPLIETDDALFLAYLKKDLERRNSESFLLYKRIQTIEFPRLGSQTHGFKYSAAVKKDIVSVKLEDVKEIQLHEICPCEHGDFSELKPRPPLDKFLIHYHHWIIEELTQGEIDLLQTEPAYMIDRESPLSPEGIDRLVVFCYDPSITEAEFAQLASEFYSSLSSDQESRQKTWEEKIQCYEREKEKLRKKKIIVLTIKGYN
jgi:hypothetical protein